MIAPYLRWNIDRWSERALRSAALFSAIWGVCLCAVFLLRPWRWEGCEGGRGVPEGVIFGMRQAYEAIGSGSLALNPAHQAAFLNLHHEIVVLAKNTRPDAPVNRSGKMLLGLKGSGEEREVSSGSCVYLSYDPSASGGPFRFSDSPTPLWMKPMVIGQGGVLIEAGRKEGRKGEEISQFARPEPVPIEVRKDSDLFRKPGARGIAELRGARLFGRDLLIERYGGGEFAALKEKMRLEFTNPPYVRYISQGDHLVFKEGRWELVLLEEVHGDTPLLYVKGLSGKEVEILAWDASGFSSFHLKLDVEPIGKLAPRPEILPKALKLRTASQVTCLLGKRRLLMRRGDWLLKTATGWRNLKRAEEVEDCLYHRLRGELFIFDSLDKEGDRTVLRGHLFDEMRTQLQPVTLPIEHEKKISKKTRK